MQTKMILLVACAYSTMFLVWNNSVLASPIEIETKTEYPNYYVSDSYNCGNLTCGGDGIYTHFHCDYFLNDCPETQKSCALTPECIETTGYTCANVDCFRARCFMKRDCDKSSPDCKATVQCIPLGDSDRDY